MTTEFKRVFGPPGCGKTTWLAQQAKAAVEKFGSDKVCISSFTRAAAVEIANRDTGVEQRQVGTLHSLCYQAMGQPELAELHVKEWNEHASADWQLSPMDNDDFARDSERTGGERLYRLYQLLRAKRTDEKLYPRDVIGFHRAWNEWKAANGFVDFTDLIDFGRRELDFAPGMPKALFVDEAQDLNPMQIELIEKWSRHTEWTIMVGDPDQAIYAWAGADPYAFHDAPAEQKFFPKSLQRSWRLPRTVHGWSVEWIRQIVERDDIVFEPRDAEGSLIKLGTRYNWRDPMELVRLTRELQGKTVAFLATCGYMLDPLKAELRAQGVPFHNPYRETRGDWNPLQKIGDRVAIFLRPCREVWGNQADIWTGPMLARWTDQVKAEGVFKRGQKARIIQELKTIARPLYSELFEIFEDGVLEEIMRRMEDSAAAACEWLLTHAINESARKRIVYPIRCVEKSGPHSLLHKPTVIIGTGHSVKGADSIDHVVLIPDLSHEGFNNWRAGGRPRDAVTRLIYVMATRAKESLMLARASGEAVWS